MTGFRWKAKRRRPRTVGLAISVAPRYNCAVRSGMWKKAAIAVVLLVLGDPIALPMNKKKGGG